MFTPSSVDKDVAELSTDTIFSSVAIPSAVSLATMLLNKKITAKRVNVLSNDL
jgi:hypothetical protein